MTNLSDEEQEALVNEPVAGPLPHERLDARDPAPAAAANADEVCAICFDAFHVGETVAQLPCGHRYHAKCVGAWLKNATTCPGCRAEVSDEAVKTAAGASNLPGLNAPDTGAAAPPAGVSQAAPPVVASAPPDQVAAAAAWPEEYGLQLRMELYAEGDRRLQAQIAAADHAGAHVVRTLTQPETTATARVPADASAGYGGNGDTQAPAQQPASPPIQTRRQQLAAIAYTPPRSHRAQQVQRTGPPPLPGRFQARQLHEQQQKHKCCTFEVAAALFFLGLTLLGFWLPVELAAEAAAAGDWLGFAGYVAGALFFLGLMLLGVVISIAWFRYS